MQRITALFTILFLIFIAPTISTAGEAIRVTVEGSAPLVSGDIDKARQAALVDAERNAVAKALAGAVTIEKLLVNLRLSDSILSAIPFGRVTEKKILKEEKRSAPDTGVAGHRSHYWVRIKAAVIQEALSDASPPFQIDAKLNQSVFSNGQTLKIHMRSPQDCYFAVFNILEDNTILQLLPNRLSPKNHLTANENFIFPAEADQNHGIELRLHLPKDKAAVTESIYILALLQPFELDSLEVQENGYRIFKGQQTFMRDIVRAVVSTPVTHRSEKLLQYEIR